MNKFILNSDFSGIKINIRFSRIIKYESISFYISQLKMQYNSVCFTVLDSK